MYIAYYVPNFPINQITDDGRDQWINNPSHIRYQCGFLQAILEHIDNTNHIDPIRIVIPVEGQVQAGPAGTARLYALTYLRGYTHIPAIVSTQRCYDWFGEDVVEIKDKEQLRSYFLLEPADYGIEPDGKVYWQNQNPNEKQMRETYKVSSQTIDKLLRCI
jgi:hypothetical protein